MQINRSRKINTKVIISRKMVPVLNLRFYPYHVIQEGGKERKEGEEKGKNKRGRRRNVTDITVFIHYFGSM